MKQKKLIANKKGVAAVEFAIVLPILVVLTFGIIEFGLVMYDKAVITNASREGARDGVLYREPALGPTGMQTEVNNVVTNYCANYLVSLGASGATPTVNVNGDCGTAGNEIDVSVTYPYTFAVLQNLVHGMTGIENLTADTVMQCEGD